MKLSEVLRDIRYDTRLSAESEIKDISSDSRFVDRGDLFICLKGTKVDGHEFARTALEKGAAAIAVERDMGLPRQIIITDTRKAYPLICANYFGRPADKLSLIGITGTNGKTTVSYIIKHILDLSGKKSGLIGTIQNIVGDKVLESCLTTPDCYDLQSLFAMMVEEECTHCVMEVSSHSLEQGRVKDLHFDTAVFTNLSQDHLDYHGTMENYFKAKKKLFDMCDTAVINVDDRCGEELATLTRCNTVTYGIKNNADIKGDDIELFPESLNMKVSYRGKSDAIKAGIPGEFSAYNFLAAIGASIASRVPVSKVLAAAQTAGGVKGRAEVYPTGRDFTVIIDYAHTPDGLENILKAMRTESDGRLVVLFGCGGDRDAKKRPLMGETASRLADFVVVTSDNPRSENPRMIIEDIVPGVLQHDTPYAIIENRRKAIEYVVENALPGDIIVLAGKGHETYQILESGRIHFDEREILAEVLAQQTDVM